MPRAAPLLAALALAGAALPAAAADRAALLGRWAMQLDPSQVMELRADGTGTFAGEAIRWRLDGDRLAITDRDGQTDVNGVQVKGDTLALVGQGGMAVAFQRVSGAAKAPPAGGRPGAGPGVARGLGAAGASGPAGGAAKQGAAGGAAKQGAGGGSAVDPQVRQLLLSSAWCSFSYRSTPGGGGYGSSSSSSRVVFRQDGTGHRSTSRETYSTGSGGQYAGGGQGGDAFRWQVREGRLLVDSGAGFEDVNLTGTRNSAGYPILTAGGVEYSMCN